MTDLTDLPSNIPTIANTIVQQPDPDTLPTDQPDTIGATARPTGIDPAEPALLDQPAPAPSVTADLDQAEPILLDAPLCSGFGKYHTDRQDNRKPKPYASITLDDIFRLGKEPQQVIKDEAQWFIPSSLHTRTADHQRKDGQFCAVWVDIDQHTTLDAVKNVLAYLEVYALIYSSRSSTDKLGFHNDGSQYFEIKDGKKVLKGGHRWRVILPLAEPQPASLWVRMAAIVNDRFQGMGIQPDRNSERVNQICYLPNRGEFYQSEIIGCNLLSVDAIADELAAKEEEERANQERLQAATEQARLKATQRMAQGEKSPIKAFNHAYPVEQCLEQYGYQRHGNRWISPNSESGNPGVTVKNHRWISSHASDGGIGKLNTHSCSGDAFDLFKHYEHGGDHNAALKAAGAMFTGANGKTITQNNQQAYRATQDESDRAIGAAAAQALWDKSAKTRMMAVPNQQPPSDPGIDNQAESPPPLDTDSITDTDTPKYKPGQTRNAMSRNGFVSYVAQFNEAGVEIEWESRLKNLVELMNKHHVLTTIGGKTRVMKITADDDGHNKYEFIAPKEFVQIYGAYFLQVGWTKAKEPTPIFADYATAWLKNPGHRVYGDGVLFEPGKKLLASQFNMWQGFAVEPKENLNLVALAYIYWHINEIICGGNPELIQYFYDWVAYTFQNPDKPAGTALVCRGEKGTGKGIIAQFLLKIWGKHGFTISSSKHLVGNFNAHLADTCFLFADEAFFSADKQGEGRLKALITEPLIPIERKGVDVIQQPNYLKIFMATNSDWAVPASRDERRYCVFDVSAAKKGDTDYFKAIGAAIEDPAVQAAFLHDMLHHDLSQYHSGNIPESKGLQDQRMHSLDSAGKWLLDSLNNGYFEARNEASKPIKIEWNTTIPASDLWNSYIFWCDEARTSEHHRMTQTMLGKYLGDIGFTKKTSNGVKRIFGTLGEAIAKFEAYHKIKFEADF